MFATTIAEWAQQPLRNVHNNHCGMCTETIAESRDCIYFYEYKWRRRILLTESHTFLLSVLLLKKQSQLDGHRFKGGKGGLQYKIMGIL
jgi:hypothetical protein